MAIYPGPYEPIPGPDQSLPSCNWNALGASESLAPPASSDHTSGVIRGPAYNWPTDGSTSLLTDCYWMSVEGLAEFGRYRVLKSITYSTGRENVRLQGWRDPNVQPPIPPNFLSSGLVSMSLHRSVSNYTYPGNNSSAYIYSAGWVYWNSTFGYWYAATTRVFMNHSYHYTEGYPVNICPPGTEFNPISGTCDILPNYTWNGEFYQSDFCVKIENMGDVYEGEVMKFRIATLTDKKILTDAKLYISYVGSTAGQYDDFTPVHSIIMKAGTSEYILEIQTHFDSDIESNEKINITITGEEDSDVNVCYAGDGTAFGYILESGEEVTGAQCGEYFSKGFKDWMSCTNFDEPEYPGNMLKDGTILE